MKSMKSKLAIFALILAIPAGAYAWTSLGQAESCPTTPDCPCAH
jgi:hypothetical protein